MKRRRHGLKKRSGNAQTSSPRCAFRRPAMRSPDDWRRRKKLSRALSRSTPTCALPISRIASAFFAGRKIMQNMKTLCAGLDCRNEPFGTTTLGLRLDVRMEADAVFLIYRSRSWNRARVPERAAFLATAQPLQTWTGRPGALVG